MTLCNLCDDDSQSFLCRNGDISDAEAFLSFRLSFFVFFSLLSSLGHTNSDSYICASSPTHLTETVGIFLLFGDSFRWRRPPLRYLHVSVFKVCIATINNNNNNGVRACSL